VLGPDSAPAAPGCDAGQPGAGPRAGRVDGIGEGPRPSGRRLKGVFGPMTVASRSASALAKRTIRVPVRAELSSGSAGRTARRSRTPTAGRPAPAVRARSGSVIRHSHPSPLALR
jgi:hypothetical protein